VKVDLQDPHSTWIAMISPETKTLRPDARPSPRPGDLPLAASPSPRPARPEAGERRVVAGAVDRWPDGPIN
jgi:hypothetical protein